MDVDVVGWLAAESLEVCGAVGGACCGGESSVQSTNLSNSLIYLCFVFFFNFLIINLDLK